MSIMIFPYSPRRRKNALVTVTVLLAFICLVDYYCRAKLEEVLHQRSKSWDVSPFQKRIGNDVVQNVLKLKQFQEFISSDGITAYSLVEMEKELFPYINWDSLESNQTTFWPIYKKWDGTLYQGFVPTFSPANTEQSEFIKIEFNGTLCFWENWLQAVIQPESKGIVISVGMSQVNDTISLISVLRYLKNTMPIQIVHVGDLTSQQQDRLVHSARTNPSYMSPSQQLWFVNVSSILNTKYAKDFSGYSNKWLALIFSSFESVILMDADTVPFVPLERYFDYEQFQTTGTIFFKDRKMTLDRLSKVQLETLERITAKLLKIGSSTDSTPVHDLLNDRTDDPIAAQTLKSLFENGDKHHMESGLVVIDKRRHLMSLLTSISLQLSSINGYFHGDKEWFWFAQFLRNETFTFHPKDASNIGNLGVVVSNEPGEFYQICSVQLSHTELDGSVLWVNGGLRTCKKDSWDDDFKQNKRLSSMFETSVELKKYYEKPVELEGAIIPDVKVKPWIHSGECSMFSYCTLYKEGEFGELLKFNELQKQAYREIVEAWNLPIAPVL